MWIARARAARAYSDRLMPSAAAARSNLESSSHVIRTVNCLPSGLPACEHGLPGLRFTGIVSGIIVDPCCVVVVSDINITFNVNGHCVGHNGIVSADGY